MAESKVEVERMWKEGAVKDDNERIVTVRMQATRQECNATNREVDNTEVERGEGE